MPKIAWVLLPLVAYGLYVAWAALRGRLPQRFALNVQTSLLLVAYLLGTAGLGIFWVANQQLPVFDWHYLFGYATLLLVTIHLVFNLPTVVRWFRRGAQKPAQPDRRAGAVAVGKAALVLGVLTLAFYLGTRQSDGPASFGWRTPAVAGTPTADVAATTAADAVARYHEFSSESRKSVFRRAQGVDWGEAPPDFKTYDGVPRIALPRADGADRPFGAMLEGPAAGGRLTLAALGELLHLSAGVTGAGGSNKRAAPSSGALFPGELYVIARRVEGLAPGLYHYDPQHDRLDALGGVPADAGVPQAGDADATVLLAAIFRRTGYKYRDRAYRYAAADAGHLLENLRLASHKAGMQVSVEPRFDEERAARAIRVDGVEEGVLAAVTLRAARRGGGVPGARDAAGAVPPAWRPAPPPDDSAIGVTGMVHQATSLRLDAALPAGERIALPPPHPAARGLRETIVERRSKRRFLARQVSLVALSSLLADVAQPALLSDAVRINLVVDRVEGLAPGVYRYVPGHALVRVRAGRFADAANAAALSQDVIGDAAVVLVLSADRAAALAPGARGYRQTFLEAGMMGERWLLGAVARGLGACPVGAFYDDEAAALVGVDPRREWVLHFAALGWADE